VWQEAVWVLLAVELHRLWWRHHSTRGYEASAAGHQTTEACRSERAPPFPGWLPASFPSGCRGGYCISQAAISPWSLNLPLTPLSLAPSPKIKDYITYKHSSPAARSSWAAAASSSPKCTAPSE
jgi:hypothetical protein